jgi:hypothetical protein
MSFLHLVLWFGGLGLVALGVLRLRGPLARQRALRETQENLARYDDWRGSRIRPEPGEKTGADVMAEVLRRQVLIWGGVIAAGIVLIAVGFLIR